MKKKLGVVALIVSLIWIMYLGFIYNRTYFEHYPKVTVTVAERKPFIQDISTTGYIEPAARFTVRSGVSGMVEEINVKIGDHVKKGQILIQIYSPELELQIEDARLNIEKLQLDLEKLKNETYDISQYELSLRREEESLSKAKEELERAKELFRLGIISPAEYSNYESQYKLAEISYNLAKTNYENAKKQYESQETLKKSNLSVTQKSIENARTQLDLLYKQRSIRSDVEGKVISIFVKKGENVTAGTSLLLLADERTMSISCLVDPKYMDKLELGQEIRFKVDPFSTREFKAEVYSISEGIEELRGKTGIKVSGNLKEDIPDVKIDIPVYARILIKSRELSVVVPIASIYQESPEGLENPLYYLSPPSEEDTEYYIFVVEGTPSTPDEREFRRLIRDNIQVVRKKKVEVGGISEGEAEITSGLNQFERVVTYSTRPLIDYDRVIVIEREKWSE